MTNDELKEIEARRYDEERVCSCGKDVPALIAAIRERDARIERLRALANDMLDELRPYSYGRRDKSSDGWQKEWRYVKIKTVGDYEHYPNHVPKETIEEFEKALEADGKGG